MPKVEFKKRSTLSSSKLEEIKKKKRAVRKRKFIVSVVCLCSLMAGFVFASRWSEVNIQNIQIKGNQVLETEILANAINSELSGKYLALVPKSNFLLYPKVEIKNKLSESFKRLKNIDVYVKDPKTLEVALTERETRYTWCGENPPEEEQSPDDDTCYFVDGDGYVFDKAPYFSGDVYFRLYGALGSKNSGYFSGENFSKLMFWRESIKNMGLFPSSMYVKADGDVEIYLSSTKNPAPKIIIKSDSEQNKAMENLQSALDTDLKSELNNKYLKLKYIDLRFDNKVYYKFDE